MYACIDQFTLGMRRNEHATYNHNEHVYWAGTHVCLHRSLHATNMPRKSTQNKLIKKQFTRENITIFAIGYRVMGRRRYADGKIFSGPNKSANMSLQGYQLMSSDECKQTLLDVLDNKSSCVKFRGIDDLTPACHNMVTTCHVTSSKDRIDLATVARCTGNSTYDRKRFAAITLRLDKPKTTALLFSSGKVVITGAVSRQMSLNAAKSIIHLLRRLFPYDNFQQKNFIIQNMVCSITIGRGVKEIDIQEMYRQRASNCTYQPSIFPGLIFRPPNNPVVLLIFKSSRIVVTGAKKYSDIYNGFHQVFEQISPFFVR